MSPERYPAHAHDLVGTESRKNIRLCDAIEIVKAAAISRVHWKPAKDNESHARIETVDLSAAVARRAARDVRAPFATPPADTSAMDGFAISSSAAASASHDRPVRFAVKGIIAAGAQRTLRISCIPREGVWPCVEIATGARFPEAETPPRSEDSEPDFDCVVPYEHVITETCCPLGERHILVSKPPTGYQHRRFAGTDIGAGSLVLAAGTLIQPQHVMALASLGLTKMAVRPRLRVALWSTGDEVINMTRLGDTERLPTQEKHRIFDTNGPYIMSQLTCMGFDAEFLGSVKDQGDVFEEQLSAASSDGYDLLLSSGAVSAGRYDFVPSALKKASARTLFHGVLMRPGHPLLFAEVFSKAHSSECHRPNCKRDPTAHCRTKHHASPSVGFFGLPGNPLAAAVGFRLFVIPYLRALQGLPEEKPSLVVVRFATGSERLADNTDGRRTKPKDRDIFWHGVLQETEGDSECLVPHDQSPSKVHAFLASSGWVHVPIGYSEVKDGDKLPYYPILPVQPG